MKLNRERLDFAVTQEQEKRLWEEIQYDFPSYVQMVKSEYQKKLGLILLPVKTSIEGEIFFSENMFLYYLIPEDRSHIEAGGLIFNEGEQERFQKFLDKIREILTSITGTMLPEWQEVQVSHPRFEFLKEETEGVRQVEEDMEAANELSDPELRGLLKMIASQGKGTIEKVVSEEKLQEINSHLQILEDKGLVSREYVVICRQSLNQITTVSSSAALREVSERGFQCYVCGKPISEEEIELTLSCTEKGRRLAAPNYWLLLKAVEIFRKNGITDENILYNRKDHFAMEVFANQENHLILMEIKEEKIKIEDVFYYLSKIKYCKPTFLVILTLQEPAKEIFNLLAEKANIPVYIMTSLKEFEDKIGLMLARKSRDYAREILSRFEPLTSGEISSLIAEYMFVPEEMIQEQSPRIEESTEAVPEEGYFVGLQGAEGTLDSFVNRILEELTSGITEKSMLIENMMLEMNSLKGCSSILVDEQGLLQLNSFPDSFDAEAIGAFSLEISDNFNKAMAETGQMKPFCLTLENNKNRFHIYLVKEALLVVSEEGKTRFSEESGSAEPAGEPGLREETIKKILDDLNGVEGIRASIVASKDGLIMDSLSKEQVEEETFAALYVQLLTDNEKNFSMMGLHPIRQIIARTESEIISLIPLDNEGVLITLMEPNAAQDVWESKLPDVINTLASMVR